jgi:hypothetical protein
MFAIGRPRSIDSVAVPAVGSIIIIEIIKEARP